jgi:hypothetical protein
MGDDNSIIALIWAGASPYARRFIAYLRARTIKITGGRAGAQ